MKKKEMKSEGLKKTAGVMSGQIIIALLSGTIGAFTVHCFDVLLKMMSVALNAGPVSKVFWPLIGAFVAGGIIYRVEPGAMGEGMPSYLKGVNMKGGDLKISETFYKFWAALVTLGTYGNGGVVGPMGRVNSGLMSYIISKIGKFVPLKVRTAAICGMASTVGVIFQSPMGGGIFAVEILQKSNMTYMELFPAILSSLTGVFIFKMFNWPTLYEFGPVQAYMDHGMIGWILAIGVLSGLLGKCYISLYGFIAKVIKRERTDNVFLKVMIGSLSAALIAWMVNPELMGTSRDLIKHIFLFRIESLYGNIDHAIPMGLVLAALILFKAVGNCMTVGSGMSAGFTGPAAIMGLLLGAACGSFIGIDPDTANYSSLLAAGLAGMLASSMNIPLAAAIITVEVMGFYYSVPAGIAAIVGFQVNRYKTIYDFWAYSEE